MNLEDETIETVSTKDVTGNNDVELIKKVMQVEETVHCTIQKCTHSFAEKYHKTFITDYAPTQEEELRRIVKSPISQWPLIKRLRSVMNL